MTTMLKLNEEYVPGVTFRAVRNVLRCWGDQFSMDYVRSAANLSLRKARELVTTMQRDGLVEPDARRLDGEFWYTPTHAGRKIANGRGGPRFTRAKAVEAVEGFMKRVAEVNRSAEFLLVVSNVKIFGSYLRDEPTLGDVDLCVNLRKKFADPDEQERREREQRAEEEDLGRTFRNLADEVCWPSTKVYRYLKARSPILSIKCGDDPILEQCDWRFLYVEDRRVSEVQAGVEGGKQRIVATDASKS